jgi:AcrR family transcriptional regulator
MTATPSRRERDRRREEVKAALQTATVELIGTAPFKDLKVDDIARRAGFTRSAFYFYFRDKHHVLMAATEGIMDRLYQEADRWWHGEGDPHTLVYAALSGVVSVYAENAKLLRAATEVSSYDDDVRQTWRLLVERFVSATKEHLIREQKAGRSLGVLQPQTAAEALVWMTERYCYIYLAGDERSIDEVVESLMQIWVTAIYPS